jgi:hypothetical protein
MISSRLKKNKITNKKKNYLNYLILKFIFLKKKIMNKLYMIKYNQLKTFLKK